MRLDKVPRPLGAAVRPAPPRFVPPMLARAHDGRLPEGEWILERKFDGQRLVAVCDPRRDAPVRLFTRTAADVTARYPELEHALPGDRAFVLDAEVVALKDGREDFGSLQHRMHARSPVPDVPVALVVFDCMNMDRNDVTRLPLRHRIGLLEEVTTGGPIARSPRTTGDAVRLLKRACEAGWEGLMAKRLDTPYVPGRSGFWLKLKCWRQGVFLVGGHTPPRGTRPGFGALLLGEPTGTGLRYAGKVGTGFDEATLRAIHAALQRVRRRDPPFLDPPPVQAVWTEPVVSCRVAYKERTREGRLRHPRFVGVVAPGAGEVRH